MSSVKKRLRRLHIGDWVKFEYGPKNKVLAKIIEDRGRLGVGGRRLYRIRVNNEFEAPSSFEMPEDELEPEPLPPARLFFDVRYIRRGDTNVWRATTRSNGVFKGVKAKGAVGYSTAFYEDEPEKDQRLAIVQVLFEVDPGVDEAALLADQSLMGAFIKRARAEADALFRSWHPRSRVEHVDVV